MSITKSSHYSSPGTYQLTLNLISLRMRSEAASLHLCASFMAKGALLLSLPRHQETSMAPGMTLMFDINYSNLFLHALGKFRQKTNGMKKHGSINNTLIGLGSHESGNSDPLQNCSQSSIWLDARQMWPKTVLSVLSHNGHLAKGISGSILDDM